MHLNLFIVTFGTTTVSVAGGLLHCAFMKKTHCELLEVIFVISDSDRRCRKTPCNKAFSPASLPQENSTKGLKTCMDNGYGASSRD